MRTARNLNTPSEALSALVQGCGLLGEMERVAAPADPSHALQTKADQEATPVGCLNRSAVCPSGNDPLSRAAVAGQRDLPYRRRS
jgi:hypothetical protein